MHVEDHPLATLTSRARSLRASTAPAPSRSGIAARTSSSRRRRTAGSPFASTVRGSRACGHSSRPHLDGDPRNWLLLRKDGGTAQRGATRRCWRPRPTRCRAAPAGPSSRNGTASGRSPRIVGGEATLAEQERQRPHRPLLDRREGDRPRRQHTVGCARRRDLRTRRGRDAPASGCCSRARARSSSSPSTCSSATASRCSIAPTSSAVPLLASSSTPAAGGVLLSPSFDDGAALEQAAREHGLEGVLAKRVDSTYQPGRRSPDWRKLKLKQRQELVVAGYTRGKGRRSNGIGSLVLGVHDADGLRYAGNVGTGLHATRELDRLERCCDRSVERTHRSQTCRSCRASGADDVTWVEPDARGRGRVRRVDARRPASRAGLPRAARRQAGRRRGRGAVPIAPEIRRGSRC